MYLFVFQVHIVFRHLNEVSQPNCQEEFYSDNEIKIPKYGKPGDELSTEVSQ